MGIFSMEHLHHANIQIAIFDIELYTDHIEVDSSIYRSHEFLLSFLLTVIEMSAIMSVKKRFIRLHQSFRRHFEFKFTKFVIFMT